MKVSVQAFAIVQIPRTIFYFQTTEPTNQSVERNIHLFEILQVARGAIPEAANSVVTQLPRFEIDADEWLLSPEWTKVSLGWRQLVILSLSIVESRGTGAALSGGIISAP